MMKKYFFLLKSVTLFVSLRLKGTKEQNYSLKKKKL